MMSQTEEQQLRNSASVSNLEYWANRPFFRNNPADFNRVISDLKGERLPVRPAPAHIFDALRLQPQDVRVVIVGHSPYPSNYLATGLAFAVPNSTSPSDLPASLRNMFFELCLDVGGCSNNTMYDLQSWHSQGVMLLNTMLTAPDSPNPSCAGRRWKVLIQDVIDQLTHRHVFFIFLGNPAKDMISCNVRQGSRYILTRHPSCPDNVRTSLPPFFGSRVFSHANSFLHANGIPSIIW